MYDERCLKIIGANIKLIRICCADQNMLRHQSG